MNNDNQPTYNKATLGDAAVDGLLAGAGAGLLMAAYLIVVGLARGEGPGVSLGRFDPAQGGAPVGGGLAHLATAAVYGVIFGLGWRFAARWRGPAPRVPGWLAGLVYGLILFGLAVLVFLPAVASPLRQIPTLHFAVAHILYGAALGWLMARS